MEDTEITEAWIACERPAFSLPPSYQILGNKGLMSPRSKMLGFKAFDTRPIFLLA